MRVTDSLRSGAMGSGASSELLSSEAVPEPEGLGISSSLDTGVGDFLVASLGKNLSGAKEVQPDATGVVSEKKLMSNMV